MKTFPVQMKTIRSRLVLFSITVGGLLLCLALVAGVELRGLSGQSVALADDASFYLQSTESLGKTRDLVRILKGAVALADPTKAISFETLNEMLVAEYGELRKMASSKEQENKVTAILAEHTQATTAAMEIFETLKQSKESDLEFDLLLAEELFGECTSGLQLFGIQSRDTLNERIEVIRSSLAKPIIIVTVTTCMILLLLVLGSTAILKSFLPLREIATALKEVAKGNLVIRTAVKANDEIGAMASGLNTAVDSMREALQSIAQGAHSMGSASQELNTISVDLNSNAQQTASQVDSLSAAYGHVKENVDTVAESVEQFHHSIREISENTQSVSNVAQKAVTLTTDANEMVKRLGKSSFEIGSIVKAITDIAEQTNLLALNATIEAARAGEEGKGFAVVANEVKGLANETTRATEQIASTIESIQTDATDVTMAIAEIEGIVAKIYEMQTSIAAAIEEQSCTIQSIATNAEIARTEGRKILENVGHVTRAAEVTSDRAGSTRAASETMSRLSHQLGELIERFQIS